MLCIANEQHHDEKFLIMRIVFMAYDRPAYTGGPIINARRILPELVKRGHQVQALLGFHQDYPNARFLEKHGVECRVIEFTSTEIMVKWILQQLKDLQPDVFVPNISVAGGFAAKWAKQANIATIIAHRSDDEFNWGLARMFGFGFKDWQTSGLVCVTNYLKKEVLKKTRIPVEIDVIPSGVPIPEKAAGQNTQHTFSVIYTGRIEQKQKKVWDMIDAFVSLIRKYDDVQFTLLGEGSQRPELIEYIARLNLGSRIIFKDRLTGDAYHEELLKHHAVVLFSDYEGIPGSIMDGMACGLVPVCSNIEGVNELVQHNHTGILLNNRKEDMVKSLGKLKADRTLRSKLAHNARQHIINNYSLDIAVDRWEVFFRRLIFENCHQIIIPRVIKLPPVLPELAREDRRVKKSKLDSVRMNVANSMISIKNVLQRKPL